MANTADSSRVERVQVGVRIEKRIVQVLKGLAEFEGISLGQLLEAIVLHSFVPIEGCEGEACASPFSTDAIEALGHLRKVYGLDAELAETLGLRQPTTTS